MLAAEAQGLALDFTDGYWWTSTGRYGSARVKDTTTPANNYDSIPGNLLTYTGTTKMTRQSDGVYRYGPHNIALQSEDFATTWIDFGGTVTTNDIAAPNGTLTADKYTENTSTSRHGKYLSYTAVAGENYTHALRVKAGTRSLVMLGLRTVTGTVGYAALFDLAAGTVASTYVVGAPTGVSNSIQSLGGGWYLISVSADAASTGIYFEFGASNSTSPTLLGNIPSYLGNGSGYYYVWGAHCYKNPADSTYIATTTEAKFGLPYEWGVNLTDGTNNSQTVTVRATTSAYNKTTYLVSYDGAGSVTLSGGTTGAVTSGTPFYLTSSTTSLVLTVTGSISNLQVREFLGILVEPQATNTCLLSTYFSNATWQDSAPNLPTIARGSSNGPRGPSTMTTLTAATGGVSSQVRQITTLSGLTQYCFSLYVKQGTAASSRILVRDGTNGVNFLEATALTWSGGVPSIGGTTGIWATPVHIGDGVYRISGYGTTGAGASVSAWISIFPDNAAGTGTLIVDAAQIETGSVATSPIITYAASATRAADSISLATTAFPASTVSGTLYVRIAAAGASLSINNGIGLHGTVASSDRVQIRGSYDDVTSGGVSYATLVPSGQSVSTSFQKRAVAYAQNNFAGVCNGGAVATDSSGSTPSNLTSLDFAVDRSPSLVPHGYISHAMYLPRRMTNTELQTVTT